MRLSVFWVICIRTEIKFIMHIPGKSFKIFRGKEKSWCASNIIPSCIQIGHFSPRTFFKSLNTMKVVLSYEDNSNMSSFPNLTKSVLDFRTLKMSQKLAICLNSVESNGGCLTYILLERCVTTVRRNSRKSEPINHDELGDGVALCTGKNLAILTSDHNEWLPVCILQCW